MLPFGLAMEQANAAINAALADCEIVIDDLFAVPAIWRDPHADAMSIVDTTKPSATVLGPMPVDPRRGMSVRHPRKGAFRIIGVEPDGAGGTTLVLEEA